MSKLIFPEHGGMYVDDNAIVVKTIKHTDRDGIYTVKIAATPDPIDSRYKCYQWHYLAPGGGVAGTSGYRSTIAESMASAIDSIKENIRRHRQKLTEARKTPSQKAQDRLRKRTKFFIEHAGVSYRPGKETKAQGRRRGAEALARAEQYAEEQGWKVEWDYDQNEYQMGDAETEMPNEVLVAVLRDADGHVLESLGGIGDPSDSCRRVVEAELALEAMPC